MANNSLDENGHTKVDMPSPLPHDGNWRTIDLDALYDSNKCDLTECDLSDLYRILE